MILDVAMQASKRRTEITDLFINNTYDPKQSAFQSNREGAVMILMTE